MHPTDLPERLCRLLDNRLRCDSPLDSFSPHFSSVGLSFAPAALIPHLHLHYNRNTTTLGRPFATLRLQDRDLSASPEISPLGVSWQFADVPLRADLAFFAPDAWMLQLTAPRDIQLHLRLDPFNDKALTPATQTSAADSLFQARFPATDRRCPDPDFPFALAVRFLSPADPLPNAAWQLSVTPNQPARILCAAACHTIDPRALLDRLDHAPRDIASARAATAQWIAHTAGSFTLPPGDSALAVTAATALWTLLSNLTRAPGKLAGRAALFPNRGRYACHYLWDACFHNLALELMDPALARDSLLLLTDNIEPDGKIPQFVCPTWNRPGSSQNPLVGWAAWRLYQRTADRDFLAAVYPALCRNTDWWLANRDAEASGLISCFDPFEIWDDTPRLDRGPIKPADANAYLSIQMDVCARAAEILGDPRAAAQHRDHHRRHLACMIERLYCPADNLFYDWSIPDQSWLKLKTPACFIPLLTEVPLTAQQRTDMIQRHLLNPAEFFGPVPFPVVAYHEPSYQPHAWWRGPTWPPIAFFMLEILHRHSFTDHHRHARRRLLEIMTADAQLHELFDSQTGQGLGAPQQGWTAAIFLRLCHDALTP